jgi:hypothetical protein
VLDVMREETGIALNMSHIAAREEVRNLLRTLDIEAINTALKEKMQQDIRQSSSRAAENTRHDEAAQAPVTASAEKPSNSFSEEVAKALEEQLA